MEPEVEKYRATGVDYSILDAAKRAALAAATQTSATVRKRGVEVTEASRGEPAFVFNVGDRYFAFVMECLGTKSSLALEYLEVSGRNLFGAIGFDTVAAAVNDLACIGALPLVVNAYFATGAPSWFRQDDRFQQLVGGWKDACDVSGATWGGGETPGLSGIIAPNEIDLAASVVGLIPEGQSPLLGDELRDGDEIVFLASTGIHTNGLSLARAVAATCAGGLSSRLPSGVELGEALLTPSAIYVPVVEALLSEKIPLTYVSNITGHGLRKLMRPRRDLSYRITQLLPVPEVLAFLAAEADLSEAEAYATLNMGVGLAVYSKKGTGRDVVDIATANGIDAIVAGRVETGPRRVILDPLSVRYEGDQLRLR